MQILFYFILFAAVLLMVVLTIMTFSIFGLWLQSYLSGAPISLVQLIGMKLRKSPAKEIVTARIKCIQNGIPAHEAPTLFHLESHALSGGDVTHVVDEFVAAHRSGKSLSFEQVAAADLGPNSGDARAKQKANMSQPGMAGDSGTAHRTGLVGTRLQAITAIPPAGRIELPEIELLALSDDVEIRRGEEIEIVRMEGDVAIVRRV